MGADDMVNLIRTIVPIDHLPANEGQCRELACVPENKLPEVWQSVCEHAEKHREPITAKVIRQLNKEELSAYGNHYKSYVELKDTFLNEKNFKLL